MARIEFSDEIVEEVRTKYPELKHLTPTAIAEWAARKLLEAKP